MPEAITAGELFTQLAKLLGGEHRLPVMLEGRDGYVELAGIVVVPAQQKFSGLLPAYVLLKMVRD